MNGHNVDVNRIEMIKLNHFKQLKIKIEQKNKVKLYIWSLFS